MLLPLLASLALARVPDLAPDDAPDVAPDVAPDDASDPREPVSVLVSSLQARNDSAEKLASLIENFLASKLAEQPTLRVLRIEDTPPFQDYDARVYMESCPPGDIVGCTLLLGERGEVAWAVTGTVQALVSGTKVDIDILDIQGSRVAVSFTSELDSGKDEAFAEGVAKVLVAAIAGEVGKETDIRMSEGGGEESDPADKAAVARELQQLAKELGGFDVVVRRTDQHVERSSFTAADLIDKMDSDAQKPWDRLKMTPGEYLRYKNSGLVLEDWRKRQQGRKFQLLIRGGGGFFNGPVDGRYYGRKALDGETLAALDTYSEESTKTGSSGMGFFGAAFGVHPMVDVGAYGGVVGGKYRRFIDTDEVVDQTHIAPDPVVEGNLSYFGGGEVTMALLPTLKYRPMFGGGILVIQGTTIGDHVDPASFDLPVFEAATLILANVFVGGELQLTPQVDLFVKLPITVLVGGETVQSTRITEDKAVLEALDKSAGANAVGAALLGGVQVRLFGARVQKTTLLDEIDE